MQARTVRKRGEKGTRKRVERFGDRLVCIRYRYDPGKQRRFKTSELIIESQAWVPSFEQECAESSWAGGSVGEEMRK